MSSLDEHPISSISLQTQNLSGSPQDDVRGWESKVLQLLGVWGWHLATSDSLNWSVQVVESLGLHDLGTDLGTDTECWETGLDGDQVTGLLDGLNDGWDVQWLDGSQVEDLGVDTVLLVQDLGSVKTVLNVSGVRHQGDVGTLLLDLGLTEWDDEVVGQGLLGDVEGVTVGDLVLQENNRVRVSDGSLEQTSVVLGGERRNNLQTWDGTVPGSVTSGVSGGDTGGGTVGASEGDVTWLDTTGHVQGLGGGVDDVVNGLHGEVEGHELTHGLQAGQSRTDGQTGETHFGDRGVDDSSLAESIEQASGNLVGTVVSGDLLTHEEHVVVSVQLLSNGRVQGVSDSHGLWAGSGGGHSHRASSVGSGGQKGGLSDTGQLGHSCAGVGVRCLKKR